MAADLEISLGANLDELEKKIAAANKQFDETANKAEVLERIVREIGAASPDQLVSRVNQLTASIEKAAAAGKDLNTQLTASATPGTPATPRPPAGGGGEEGGFDFESFIEGSRHVAATRNEIINLAKAEALLDAEIKKITSSENEQRISLERVNDIFKQSLDRNPALKIEANEAKLLETIRKLLNAYEALGTGVIKAGEEEVRAANAAIAANEKQLASLRRLGEEEERRKLRADQIARVTVQAELQVAAARTKNIEEARVKKESEAVAKDREVINALRRQQEEFKKTGEAGVLAGTNIEETWTRVQRFFVASVITRALNTLSNAFRQSITDAAAFQISIAELRTISQENQLSFEGWTAGVRKLSEEFGRPSAEIAAGVYETLSAQVAKGAQSFEFLEQASQLARTTQASTAEAVRATTDIMNAFGLTLQDQERISAALFKTVDLGNLRLNELSGTIGRVGFTAKAVGLDFEQVLAGLSLITRQGVRADEAITFLNNAINQLAKPTDALKGLFTELGVATGEEAIQIFGFTGFLKILAERAQNSASILAALGGELRATKALFALTANDGKNFIDEVAKIKDSKESFTAARKEFENLPGEKFRQQQEKIKNFFTIDVGQGLVNSIAAINDGIVQVSSAVKAGTIAFTVGAAAVTAYKIGLIATQVAQNLFGASTAASRAQLLTFTGATKAATTAVVTLGTAFKTALIGTGIGAAVLGITFALSKLIEAFDQANEKQKELQELGIKLEADRVKAQDEATQKIIESTREERDDKIRTFTAISSAARRANTALVETSKDLSKTASERLKAGAEEILEPIRQILSQAREEASRAKSDIESGRRFLNELRAAREGRIFETQLRFEGDPGRQVRLIENQIRALQTKRAELESRGDVDSIERARKLTQEIIRLQEQRFETEANIRKRQGELGLIPTGERINVFGQRERVVDLSAEQLRLQRDVNKEIERQEQLEARIARQREEQIRLAKERAVEEKIQLALLEQAIKDLASFKTTDEKGKLKEEFKGRTAQESFDKVQRELDRIFGLVDKNIPESLRKNFFDSAFVRDRLRATGVEVRRAAVEQGIDNASLALQNAKKENDAKQKENETAITDNRNNQKQALEDLLGDAQEIAKKGLGFRFDFGSVFLNERGIAQFEAARKNVENAQKTLEENIKAFNAGDKSQPRIEAIVQGTTRLEEAFSKLQAFVKSVGGEEALKKLNTIAESGGKATKTTADLIDEAERNLKKFTTASKTLTESEANIKSLIQQSEDIGKAAQKVASELIKLPGVGAEASKKLAETFTLKDATDKITEFNNAIRDTKELIESLGELKPPSGIFGPPSPAPVSPVELPPNFNPLQPVITPTTPAPIQTSTTTVSKAETFTTNIGGVTINFSSTSSLSPDIVREVAFLLERQFSSGNIPNPFRGNGEVT